MRRGRTPERTNARQRLISAAALAVILPLGLIWRLAPLHLPQFAFKYGGSALWAMAVYWVVALLFPWLRPIQVAGRAGVVAFGVEFGKLLSWAPLDRFRETIAGKLLLGRHFTWGAIAAYWIAIGTVAVLDRLQHPDSRELYTRGVPRECPELRGP